MNDRHVSTSSRERWLLCLLVVVSLALRLGYLQEIRTYPLFTNLKLDEEYHDRWAQSIASGNILGDEVFFRAPFYPYALGIMYRIAGHNLIIPRIIQHVLGSLSILLLFPLAKNLFGKRSAWIASVLYALYPFVMYIEDQLLLESVIDVEVLLLFFLLYRNDKNPRILRWFWIGVVSGILCLTRPTFLVLPVMLIGYLVFRYLGRYGWKKIILLGCAVTAGATIMIAPVALRNYLVGNDTVLIASQGGINFYMGNNPDASGYLSAMPGAGGVRWEYRDFVNPVRMALGRDPRPSELSDYWYGKGMQFFRTDPVGFLKLFAKKNYLFWSAFEIPNNQNFYSFEHQSAVLNLNPLGFWLIGPLGLLGMVFAWRSRRGRFAVAFILIYSLLVALFFVCDRFRMPVLPLLCICSGLAVVSLYEIVRRKQFRDIGLSVILLVLFGWLTNSNRMNFGKEDRKTELFFLGNAALESKQYDNAIADYRECTAMPGQLPDVFLNWGVALWNAGRVRDALQKFQEELRLFPESYNTLSNISQIYLLGEQNDSALTYATRALNLKPYASAAFIDMGLAYSNLQQYSKADSILTLGKIRCGNEGFLYGSSVLAGIHLTEGNNDRAEDEYRGVLQMLKSNEQPSYLPEYQFSRDYAIMENFQNFKAKIYYSMGHVFLQKNIPDSAIAYFTLATDESPGFADAWSSLGNTWLALNRPSSACVALGKCVEIEPENPDAWYRYGTALRESGKITEARGAFTNALKIDSTFQEAREALMVLPVK